MVRPSHTNYLILCRHIHAQQHVFSNAYFRSFQKVNSYTLRTRSLQKQYTLVQLACVKPIASVHSEPGSNSYVSFLSIIKNTTLSCTKRVLPAAGSPTATLLRLHISHNTYSAILKIYILCITKLYIEYIYPYNTLCKSRSHYVTGRCVQGLDTNSP